MEQYTKLAKFIVANVGGKKNIKGIMHCMTRLRMILKDESKADRKALEDCPDILSVVKGNGQFQIVIGTAVKSVYEAVLEAYPELDEEQRREDSRPAGGLEGFTDLLSKIFTPVLPVLGATGMIKGILVLLTTIGLLSKTSGVYQLLFVVGDSFIYYLPIYLGYTAAKYFKSNTFVGMTIGACLIHPNILKIMSGDVLFTLFEGTMIQSSVYTTFLGIPVLLMNYTSSAIPVILAVFFAGKAEKAAKRILPGLLHTFLVPLTVLTVTVPLTFMVIGPVATWVGNILGQITLAIYNISPVIAGAVIGAIWEFCIMFGMHRSFTPITLNNISIYGYDQVFAARFAFPVIVSGVLLALTLRNKSSKDKAVVFPAFISAFFGITEPGLYGVILANIKLMIITAVSTGATGALFGIFGARFYVLGGGGIFVFPSFLNPEGIDARSYGAVTALLAGFALAFILTFLFGTKTGKEGAQKEAKDKEQEIPFSAKNHQILGSPAKGTAIPLQDVKDEVFAKEIVGKGGAVIPAEGSIYAPASGTVTMVFPGSHAIGITSDTGIELIVHIGIDTVKLEGKGFESHVKNGDKVEKGQLLVKFDQEEIRRQYDITTMVIVTNTNQFLDIVPVKTGEVEVGEDLLAVIS
ncbi:MAG: PTS transporter subunit EIIC [Hungatella sp.]|nr:PTS transporter subunit EIIC [Hungatella sp.]